MDRKSIYAAKGKTTAHINPRFGLAVLLLASIITSIGFALKPPWQVSQKPGVDVSTILVSVQIALFLLSVCKNHKVFIFFDYFFELLLWVIMGYYGLLWVFMNYYGYIDQNSELPSS